MKEIDADRLSEARMFLAEIQADAERVNTQAQGNAATPTDVRSGVAMLADKIDTLVDLMRV